MYVYICIHVHTNMYTCTYVALYFVSVKALCLGSDTAEGFCAADYLRYDESGNLKWERGHEAIAFRLGVPFYAREQHLSDKTCMYMHICIYIYMPQQTSMLCDPADMSTVSNSRDK